MIVTLTPLKGTYVIFANRNGKLPTQSVNELFSMNNHLELLYQSYEQKQDEYVIGIQLSQELGTDQCYQYLVSFVYANKPLKLNPGIISQHMVSDATNFIIEVTNDMKELLILKSIYDGFNLQLCAQYTSTEA